MHGTSSAQRLAKRQRADSGLWVERRCEQHVLPACLICAGVRLHPSKMADSDNDKKSMIFRPTWVEHGMPALIISPLSLLHTHLCVNSPSSPILLSGMAFAYMPLLDAHGQ